ncbi:MAG: PEP-CTERM sorting domain-containing protein [Sedimentisphaerales bacterium]
MKKFLSLVLVLALCGLVSADLLDLKVASRGPSETGTTTITGVKDITINPSEWLDLNIYWTGTTGYKLATVSVLLTVTGPGSIDLFTQHLTSEDEDPTMQLTEPANAWDPDLRWINVLTAGKSIILDYSMASGISGNGNAKIALDHIMFHCDGGGDVIITMVNTTNSHAMNTLEYQVANPDNQFVPNFGGPVTIHQIPEPATIALLCLGGLLLRKKR